MIPPQAMLMQPLTQTIDANASLGPVMFALALAAIVCGAVLVALGDDASRSGAVAAPTAATEAERSAASWSSLRGSAFTRPTA